MWLKLKDLFPIRHRDGDEPTKPGHSVNSHLMFLVIATVLPVMVLAGVMFWQHVKLQRSAVYRGMTDTARALSLAVDREIGQGRAIIETLAASSYLDTEDFRAFYDLSSEAALQRKGSWIVLFNRSGQQILNTLRPFGTELPNSIEKARETSAESSNPLRLGEPETLKKVIRGEAAVTDLFIGTASKQPVVSIALPVRRQGKVAYLLAMVISPERFDKLLLEQRLPSNWIGLIVDSKGMIISRQPDPEKFIGRPLPRLKTLLTDVEEGAGVGQTREGIDLYRSFSQSQFTHWAVVVGAPKALIDAPVKRSIYILAGGAVGLTLLAVGIALFLGKHISAPIRSLAGSAEALQRGENIEMKPCSVREVVELHAEFVRSVAARQQLEKELLQAHKLEAIGTLAAGIAHDFNNTLNVIRAYAMLIGKQATTDERITESAKVIDQEVQRGAAVVRQLMTIARKTESSLVRTDINQLVLTARNLITRTFPRTIEVKPKLDPALKPALADSNQITQALLDICLNSRDAMPQGGELTLATEMIDANTLLERHPEASARPHVCITIADTGSGMDESVRSRAFEPFFTTKPVGEGTGLGLAMVYGIVKNHHGMVDIDSEPGAGTAIRLYLPAFDEESAYVASGKSEETVRPVEMPPKPSTVLVVEDEEAMVYVLKKALSNEGYRVLVAMDGAEAIEVHEQHRNEIDLALIDLGLPKRSGGDVIRILKQVNEKLKVIVTTGYLEPKLKGELVAAGVNDYIFKPYTLPDIVESISHQLGNPDSSPEQNVH